MKIDISFDDRIRVTVDELKDLQKLANDDKDWFEGGDLEKIRYTIDWLLKEWYCD